MSIKNTPSYSVHCDEPECTYSSKDTSEFSGWADRDYAEEEWENADQQIIRTNNVDRHYCYQHRKPICDDCGEQVPVDDDDLCVDCADNK